MLVKKRFILLHKLDGAFGIFRLYERQNWALVSIYMYIGSLLIVNTVAPIYLTIHRQDSTGLIITDAILSNFVITVGFAKSKQYKKMFSILNELQIGYIQKNDAWLKFITAHVIFSSIVCIVYGYKILSTTSNLRIMDLCTQLFMFSCFLRNYLSSITIFSIIMMLSDQLEFLSSSIARYSTQVLNLNDFMFIKKNTGSGIVYFSLPIWYRKYENTIECIDLFNSIFSDQVKNNPRILKTNCHLARI